MARYSGDVRLGEQLWRYRARNFPQSLSAGLSCFADAIISSMFSLNILRNSPWLARLALLWFALTLGVAVASPIVHPQEELVICTGSGMQKVLPSIPAPRIAAHTAAPLPARAPPTR